MYIYFLKRVDRWTVTYRHEPSRKDNLVASLTVNYLQTVDFYWGGGVADISGVDTGTRESLVTDNFTDISVRLLHVSVTEFTSYLHSDLLQGVVRRGRGNKYRFSTRPMASAPITSRPLSTCEFQIVPLAVELSLNGKNIFPVQSLICSPCVFNLLRHSFTFSPLLPSPGFNFWSLSLSATTLKSIYFLTHLFRFCLLINRPNFPPPPAPCF